MERGGGVGGKESKNGPILVAAHVLENSGGGEGKQKWSTSSGSACFRKQTIPSRSVASFSTFLRMGFSARSLVGDPTLVFSRVGETTPFTKEEACADQHMPSLGLEVTLHHRDPRALTRKSCKSPEKIHWNLCW